MKDRVVNLDDLELEETVAHGGRGKILFKRVFHGNDLEGCFNFVDYAELPPGTSIGRHRHGEDQEFYLVLQGRGTMELDGKTFEVKPGDIIMNRPNGVHSLKNDSREVLRIFVVEVGLKEKTR